MPASGAGMEVAVDTTTSVPSSYEALIEEIIGHLTERGTTPLDTTAAIGVPPSVVVSGPTDTAALPVALQRVEDGEPDGSCPTLVGCITSLLLRRTFPFSTDVSEARLTTMVYTALEKLYGPISRGEKAETGFYCVNVLPPPGAQPKLVALTHTLTSASPCKIARHVQYSHNPNAYVQLAELLVRCGLDLSHATARVKTIVTKVGVYPPPARPNGRGRPVGARRRGAFIDKYAFLRDIVGPASVIGPLNLIARHTTITALQRKKAAWTRQQQEQAKRRKVADDSQNGAEVSASTPQQPQLPTQLLSPMQQHQASAPARGDRAASCAASAPATSGEGSAITPQISQQQQQPQSALLEQTQSALPEQGDVRGFLAATQREAQAMRRLLAWYIKRGVYFSLDPAPWQAVTLEIPALYLPALRCLAERSLPPLGVNDEIAIAGTIDFCKRLVNHEGEFAQEDARRNVMREARTVDRLSFVTRGSQTLQTLIRYEESRGSGADENAAAAANDDSE